MPSYRRYLTGTNYCGPGGDGEIIGEVDAACARHDESYNQSYYRDYIRSQRADKVFLRDLAKSTPRGYRQRMTKYVAQRYFSAKTSFWDSFDNMLPSNNVGSGVIIASDGIPKSVYNKRKPRSSSKGATKKQVNQHYPLMIAPPGYRSYGLVPKYFKRVGVPAKKFYLSRRYTRRRNYFRNGFRKVRS